MDIDLFLNGHEEDHAHDADHSLEKNDVLSLTAKWIDERCAPEVLPFETALLDRLMSKVHRQIENIEKESMEVMDSKQNFRLILIQTELERVKYLIRSYLRTRLYKIDKHALFILGKAEYRQRLSADELTYCRRHQAILTAHYRASFLSSLPENLQRLDDTAGGLPMIEEPNLDSAVFCRVKRKCEKLIRIDDETLTLEKGSIYIIRYSSIRDLLEDGTVELI